MTVKNDQEVETLLLSEHKDDNARLLSTIYRICKKGCDAEVRQNKDGSFKVYEVKKKIAS